MSVVMPGPGPGGERKTVKLSPEAIESAAEGMMGKVDEADGSSLKSPRPVIEELNGHYHLHFDLRDCPEANDLVAVQTLLEGQSCAIELDKRRMTVFHVPAHVLAAYVEWV